MSTLENWITEVNARLGIEELGEVADPEFVTPLVLDLTRDVAHGVARPAAPITAYLLGLAVARAAGGGAAQQEVARTLAADLAAAALDRDTDAGTPGERPPGAGALPDDGPDRDPETGTALPDSAAAGTASDPAVGSN